LFAQSLDPRDWVALEVTGNAWAIAGILEPHVARVIVVSPTDTGIRQARAKTDRLDARTPAKLLWAGELDGVWTPDERVRTMRRRLARRAQLVRARSRVKNEIHAVLMRCLKDRETVRRTVCEAEATVVMSVGESVFEVDLEAAQRAGPVVGAAPLAF
jgi:transposase